MEIIGSAACDWDMQKALDTASAAPEKTPVDAILVDLDNAAEWQ